MGSVWLISTRSHFLLFPSPTLLRSHSSPISSSTPTSLTLSSSNNNNNNKLIFRCKSTPEPSSDHSDLLARVSEQENLASSSEPIDHDDDCIYGVDADIQIEKLGKNYRRIGARIGIDASLKVVWGVLTDYENLSELIPGLVESRLVERRGNFAKLFQVGEQDLAFGVKFKAKGILDCCEKDLENLPFGHKRDIEFNMVEGDFQTFEGKWSIEQITNGRHEAQAYQTTLSYIVDVKPKLWLPVRLVEGRICRDIKISLSCIREEAEKVARSPQFTVSTEI
ncbi:hypothetical protein Scep_016577 [Stephania cephalantha]|uniref:Coenzyme Q-binding protein COQ10 START domain-containing protein n=1 Tax=Stephania cephalantha TaxID=152367 RepID=A0AAP0IMW1_9MAGN